MTPGQTDPFEREFSTGDAELFESLTRGLAGLPLTRWLASYPDRIELEFRRLIPNERRSDKVPAETGEWVVRVWGGDPVIRMPGGKVIDARESDVDSVKAQLPALEHATVTRVRILEPELSLEVEFDNGCSFVIAAGTDEPDLDQWFMLTPLGPSIGVTGTTKWYYRDG